MNKLRIGFGTVGVLLLGTMCLVSCSSGSKRTTLTIATVNNGDMIRLQQLTPEFEAEHPNIRIKWVTLEENTLRERVTTDIATNSHQYDIISIGTYETPLWAKNGWLKPLDKLGPDYDENDLLPAIRESVSHDGTLYAAPFYAESSLLMYRKDLFQKAGLTMPVNGPDWDFVARAARKLNDPKNGVAGICLRGKAGWGQNMSPVTSIANSFGVKWFGPDWEPQFNTDGWRRVANFYVGLLRDVGPPGASSNGFSEVLALFQQGKCAIWMDATSAAQFAVDPKQSTVADKVGFAVSPNYKSGTSRGNWEWTWAWGIPAGSKKSDAAQEFVSWASSKKYTEMAAAKFGWANVPPGTRKSLYQNPKYREAAPFAEITYQAILAADQGKPKAQYPAWGYVIIPEYQNIGTKVGQLFAAAVGGQTSVDSALAQAQAVTRRDMVQAGYLK